MRREWIVIHEKFDKQVGAANRITNDPTKTIDWKVSDIIYYVYHLH